MSKVRKAATAKTNVQLPTLHPHVAGIDIGATQLQVAVPGDVQGGSARKVAAITEELCGQEFSASSISAITVRLDAQLAQFSRRPLREAFPYVVVDAR